MGQLLSFIVCPCWSWWLNLGCQHDRHGTINGQGAWCHDAIQCGDLYPSRLSLYQGFAKFCMGGVIGFKAMDVFHLDYKDYMGFIAVLLRSKLTPQVSLILRAILAATPTRTLTRIGLTPSTLKPLQSIIMITPTFQAKQTVGLMFGEAKPFGIMARHVPRQTTRYRAIL